MNTQTPLIRFREGSLRADEVATLGELEENVDYKHTTGGVVRMLLPLLRAWQAAGELRDPEWVAMGADAQDTVLEHDGLRLRFVGLAPEARRGYAVVKERMWALLNSNPSTAGPRGEGGIPEEAWAAFDLYQARSAHALLKADERMGGLDLLYVHDFQQLGVAQHWTGPAVPKLFHLHTPFPSELPSGWAEYFLAQMRRYDAVVVSTNRYAENLRHAGLRMPIHVIHPFIDPTAYRDPTPDDLAALRERHDLAEDDRIVLNVGRMDPMKGQDRLIRALPSLLARDPRVRLLLVGNGSFSSTRKGGLGLDKGAAWRASLEVLAKELGVLERVTFTGHLGDDLLPAAYEAAEVFCLPSTREGFGLAAIEAWRQEKPVVVCDRAGVAELVEDGVNGEVVDCARSGALAEALGRMLAGPDEARRMGRAGRDASEAATLPVGRRALERVFQELQEERVHAVA
jgi:glycosyltransferase involved in cell wall biosynthesis